MKPLHVLFLPEGGGQPRSFDLSQLSVAPDLLRALVGGFRAAVGPAGNARSSETAETYFDDLRAFARLLATVVEPPTSVSGLQPVHLDLMRARAGRQWTGVLSSLRAVFRRIEGVPDGFTRRLRRPAPKPKPKARVSSYTKEEFGLVLTAARRVIREADRRITTMSDQIRDYKAGKIVDDDVLQSEIAFAARIFDTGEIQRRPSGKLATRGLLRGSRSPAELVRCLFLTVEEAAAFVVLIVGLTGQNAAQVLTLPAAHHRADSGVPGRISTATARALKRRRPASRAPMTISMTSVPTWLTGGQAELESTIRGGLDLRSPFGVYAAALRLGELGRSRLASGNLLVTHSPNRRTRADAENGLATATSADLYGWYEATTILTRAGQSVRPDTRRLRMTFVEQKQRPVAHSPSTFVNNYLLRNRGNIDEYERIVARVLDNEVRRASDAVLQILLQDVIDLAKSDARSAAAIVGVDEHTLAEMLDGQLDTVMNSCIDNENSPYTPGGSPCGASFLLCLGCPNARAEPRHIPIQLLVFEKIEARRLDMEAIEWVAKFGLPHARLRHLFAQFPTLIVEAARGAQTADEIALVERFLSQELDVK